MTQIADLLCWWMQKDQTRYIIPHLAFKNVQQVLLNQLEINLTVVQGYIQKFCIDVLQRSCNSQRESICIFLQHGIFISIRKVMACYIDVKYPITPHQQQYPSNNKILHKCTRNSAVESDGALDHFCHRQNNFSMCECRTILFLLPFVSLW